jgi:hypothetical protein
MLSDNYTVLRQFAFCVLAILALAPGFAQVSYAGPAPEQQSHSIRGRVLDGETNEPLAFVHIIIGGSRSGGMTDIDGFFTLSHSRPAETLILSYVGYYQTVYEVPEGMDHLVIRMTRKMVELAEVVIYPGENPAHRIIRNVMEHRDANNPEKRTPFSYNSYNKFVFTGEFNKGQDEPLSKDSATVRLNRFLNDHHFFLMETVTERRFMPPSRNNETILASRVSGFENPMFALLITQMQSFSFYNNQIEISGSSYISPLAPGGLERYFFLLEDTTYTGRDSVFIISYRPARGRNFEGLKGLLYVNTNGWALQNVIAEPARENGNTRVRIQQQYELIDGRMWFPTQLNTDFELFNLDNLNKFTVHGMGRTYLQDIRLDADLRRRDFSPFHVEFSPASRTNNELFWEGFRTDTLTRRERNTYHYLDSVSRANNLERQMEVFETFLSGTLRWGRVDIGLPELLAHNRAEGFRVALSLQTNNRLSARTGFRGKLAYGFGDNRLKYGGGAHILVDRLSDLRFGYDYDRDLQERGGSSFLESRSILSPVVLRRFYLKTMDMHERHEIWMQGRTWRNYLTIRAYAASELVSQPGSILQHHWCGTNLDPETPPALSDQWFQGRQQYFETGLQFRLAYGERFILTPDRIMAAGDQVPLFHLNLAKGWKGPLEGEYSFWRLEGMFQRRFPIRMLGRQEITMRAGMVAGKVPWSRLFTAPAAYGRFSFAVPRAFATMRMDEFVSDRYVAVFWRHDFEQLLYRSPNFNPRFVLLTNAGIGWISYNPYTEGIPPASMEKGFIESGLAVRDLYKLGFTRLGLEFMYRYGPYGLPSFSDNFSLRINYSIGF